MMKNDQGFSLVELLIVVAIIAIIAGITIPSLLTSRYAANEASAIQGCKAIGSAEIAFSEANNHRYTDIKTLVNSGFLDQRFSAADTQAINGYKFVEKDVDTPGRESSVYRSGAAGYTAGEFGFQAQPVLGMGRYTYGIGPDQVVRWEGGQAADIALGTPVGQTPRGS